MDVRDAMKAGKKTIIISTGGNRAERPMARARQAQLHPARELRRDRSQTCGCPVRADHSAGPRGRDRAEERAHDDRGTISMRDETFQAMLTDVVHSFKMHGFDNIILIGDSGGNTRGMQAVAQKLNVEWKGAPLVAHVGEHYDYAAVLKYLVELTERCSVPGVHRATHATRRKQRADFERRGRHSRRGEM